jgi:HTH-type transcriptional regulator / antitoxin HipB
VGGAVWRAGWRDDVTVGADVEIETWLRRLGKRVRLLRLTREMTQDQLAAAAGMSRSFVSLIEHGAHGVDVVRLLRLATALDVPLTELICGPGADHGGRADRRPD